LTATRYLLRLLHSQGLSIDQMNMVFVGLIVSRLLYTLPAWGVLVSAGQARTDGFLSVHTGRVSVKTLLLLVSF